MTESGAEALTGRKRIERNETVLDKDIMCFIIGDFGKWQFRIALLMGLLKLSVAWFQLGIVFLAPPQKFWCKKPVEFENYTDADWIEMSKPNSSDANCHINDPQLILSNDYSNQYDIPTIPCTDFDFDQSMFFSTIVSDWNLVCSRKYFVELSQASLMFGVLLGNILFGVMADGYGRKKLLFVSIALQAISGFASGFSPWLSGFMVARFMLAFASGGIAIISFVMCMEVVGGVWRTIIPILYQVPFGVGNSIMAGLAFVLRDWRYLQIALSALSSMYLIFFFFIPESPRWLLATGQNDKAIDILEKIATFNGRDSTNIRNTINTHCEVEHEKKYKKINFKAVLQSKNMRFKTQILCIIWFIAGLCFFAFSQHVGLIGKNIFLTVTFGGLIVIPGALLCIPAVQHFGCKITVVVSQLLTSVSFLLILTVPRNTYPQDWPRVVFSGFGIFGLSVTMPALYLYTGEMYPTVIRNAGVGCTSMFSRLGSMISPFVIGLEKVSTFSPFILLSILTVIQTILLYPLPDTKGRPLPDTIQQAENVNRVQGAMGLLDDQDLWVKCYPEKEGKAEILHEIKRKLSSNDGQESFVFLKEWIPGVN